MPIGWNFRRIEPHILFIAFDKLASYNNGKKDSAGWENL
jgi:hypothetical protein